MNSTSNQRPSGNAETFPSHVVQSILDSLRGMRFGQVTVTIQDGRVVQIDRTERHRLVKEEAPSV